MLVPSSQVRGLAPTHGLNGQVRHEVIASSIFG
jgi:hypothetical protein